MHIVTLSDHAAQRSPGITCVYTMFDVDLFIQCINTRPALWEKSAKEYSDKNCKEKSWVEIVEIMYEKWLDMKSTERDEKGKIKYFCYFL